MATVDFGTRLMINEVADLIVACPDVRFLVRGEPGIGKSSLGKLLQQKTGLPMSYVDCASLELGDLSIPGLDREAGVSIDFPKKRLNLHLGGPFILILDEILKAPTAVQNMLNPTLESSNPRFGDYPIPAGSYIVLTSNLASDGVGDAIKAHTRMRIVEVELAKPNHEVWIPWAIENDMEPILVAWVRQHPEVLASYRDPGNEDNMFIYHPKRPGLAYVTGRTLERASHIVRVRDSVSPRAFSAALRGCFGEPAAESLLAFMKFADQVPMFDHIIRDPMGAPVPTSPGACVMIVFGAIQKMTDQAMPAFMKYLKRMAVEWQTVFCINIAKTPSKQAVAFSCREFAEWVGKNQDLL